MYYCEDFFKNNFNSRKKLLLNLKSQTPFYACVCTTDCVPCLPLYGIQGGNTNGRVTQPDDGNAQKNPATYRVFFCPYINPKNKAARVEIFFGILIQIVA
jgi:hypothetical protein